MTPSAFLDITLPDARRRLIWLALGLPLLHAGTPAAMANDFLWARATGLVDRALLAWMEDREKAVAALADDAQGRVLTLAMYRFVMEFLLEQAAEAVSRKTPAWAEMLTTTAKGR